MEQFPFLELIYNGSVLLTLALIYHIAPVRSIRAPAWFQQTVVGIILGVAGIVLMYTPWTFAPGIIFDTRSVLLSISGLFFGTLPTLLVMAMTVATRLYQGGAAAITGVLVILATGALGIGWRHLRRRPLTELSSWELYLFGVLVHLVMLGLMFTLPWETALDVLSYITLPVLVLYPLGTMALGLLMVQRLQREQTSQAVSESEARYRLLADNISDVLWVVNLNTRRLEYVSPSVQRLSGYTVNEIMKRPIEDLTTSRVRQMIETKITEYKESANPYLELPDTYIDEIEQPCKDGSTIWTEVSNRYTRNPQGDLLLIGVSRNISERKRVEAALRANEENFRRVVEEAPIGIFIQTERRFAYVNKATLDLFGAQSESQLIGEPVLARFHPDFAEQVAERIRQLNDERKKVALAEEKIVKLDGVTVDVEVFAVPFLFHDRHGALVFMKDISEKKQAAAHAFELAVERERTDVLTTFVQEASHEFRTPLSIMQANLYLLRKTSDEAERSRKIEQIEQQIVGISRLVEMLTESSRLQSDAPSPVQPLDLNALIAEIVYDFQGQLAANALTLHRDLASEPLPISGSSNRLYTVLRELMDNAIRFTPAGGTISLRSLCLGHEVIVEIQDSGPGIPAEVLPHIFKRFYRQDTAHTTPGLGLGLSIVKSIVEGHGGQIEVESQPGSGSLFRVVLPLTKESSPLAHNGVDRFSEMSKEQ